MNRPNQNSVEALLSQAGELIAAKPECFNLWIPPNLTLRGQPVRVDAAMAVLLDVILDLGFEPDGFEQADGGRIYKYKVMSWI